MTNRVIQWAVKYWETEGEKAWLQGDMKKDDPETGWDTQFCTLGVVDRATQMLMLSMSNPYEINQLLDEKAKAIEVLTKVFQEKFGPKPIEGENKPARVCMGQTSIPQ